MKKQRGRQPAKKEENKDALPRNKSVDKLPKKAEVLPREPRVPKES